MFNLSLTVAHFHTYTAVKESEPYGFLIFKAFLKYRLSMEPSSIWESLSLYPHISLACLVDFC